MKAILGKKIGMTQVFNEQGEVIPVTVLESEGMVVVQKKTEEKDGYNAIQVGFGDVKIKNVIKINSIIDFLLLWEVLGALLLLCVVCGASL